MSPWSWLLACSPAPAPPLVVVDTIHDAPVVLSPNVTQVAVDGAGAVWAAGNRMGLTRVEPGGRVRHYTAREGLPSPRVDSMAPAPDGSMWLGTRRGIVRYDPETGRLGPPPGIPQLSGLHVVGTDAEGAIVVALSGYGVARVRGNEVEQILEAHDLPRARGWRTLVVDQHDTVWLATQVGGLWRASRRQRGWVTSMPAVPVMGLSLGPDGALWIPTQGAGLFRASTDGAPPEPAPFDAELPRDLWAISFDPSGGAWVASEWDGLRYVPDPSGRAVHTPNADLPVPDTLALAHDGSTLWIGHAAGMSSLEGPDRPSHPVLRPMPGLGGTIMSVEATHNSVVVATAGSGVVQLTRSGMTQLGRAEGVASNELHAVVLGKSNAGSPNSWAASRFGVSRQVDGRLQHTLLPWGESPGPEIFAIATDPRRGDVWAVSRHQLYRTNARDLTTEAVLHDCALPARPTALAVDRASLWVGLSGVERHLLRLPRDAPCESTALMGPGGVDALHADPDVGLLVVGPEGLQQRRPGQPPVLLDDRARNAVDYDPPSGEIWTAAEGGLLRIRERGPARFVPLPTEHTPAAVAVSSVGVFASTGTNLMWLHDLNGAPVVTHIHSNAQLPEPATRVGRWLLQARPGGLSGVTVPDLEQGRSWPLPRRQVTALAPWDDHTVLVGTALSGFLALDLETGIETPLTNGMLAVRQVLASGGAAWVATPEGLFRHADAATTASVQVDPRDWHVLSSVGDGVAVARNGTVVIFDHDGQVRSSGTIAGEEVQRLHRKGGQLWVGTDRALYTAPLHDLARLSRIGGAAPSSAGQASTWHRGVLWSLQHDPPQLVGWRPHPLIRGWGPTTSVALEPCGSARPSLLADDAHLLVATACGTRVVPARVPAWRTTDLAPFAALAGSLVALGLLVARQRRRSGPRDHRMHPSALRALPGTEQVSALRALDRSGDLADVLSALGLPTSRPELVRALVDVAPFGTPQLEAWAALLEADVVSQARAPGVHGLRVLLTRPGRPTMDLVVLSLDDRKLRREAPRARAERLHQTTRDLGLADGDVQTARVAIVRQESRGRELWPDPAAAFLGPRSLGPLLLSDDPASTLIGQLYRQGIARHLSPYATTGAVKSPDMFYGRTAVLRALLAQEQPVALLVGPRRVGKSSLLAQLHRLLERRDGTVARLHLQGIEREEDLVILMERAGAPRASSGTLEDTLMAWTDEGPLTLLLDEADGMAAGPDGEAVLGLLRRLTANRSLGVVLSGYLELYLTALDRRGAGYNFAEIIQLGPLDPDSAHDLAVEPMTKLGMRWADDELPRRLVEQAGHYPYVVQLLCDEALRRTTDASGPELTRADLDAACRSRRVQEDFVWFVFRGTAPLTQWLCLRFCDEERLDRSELVEVMQLELPTAVGDLDDALRPLLLFGYLRRIRDDRWTWCVPLFCELLQQDPGRQRTIRDVVSQLGDSTAPGDR